MDEPSDDAVLEAVRCIPHPRQHCCARCDADRDRKNNREAWAIVREKERTP